MSSSTGATSRDSRVRAAGPKDAAHIVELSVATFGQERAPSDAMVRNRIAHWTEWKSPTVVARGSENEFLGYAFSKPNEAGSWERVDGQLAVLAQVAVTPAARGQGVGAALIARSLKTLRALGYSRVSAQLQSELVGWYERQGWTVLPKGRTKSWIEPHIQQDDEWQPDLPKGSFSPILSVYRLNDYPFLGEISIAEPGPLIEVVFDASRDDRVTGTRSVAAILNRIVREPALVRKVPPGLAAILLSSADLPTGAADLLKTVALDLE